MVKKVFAIVLVVALMFSFAACSAATSATQAPAASKAASASAPAATTAAGQTINIGVLIPLSGGQAAYGQEVKKAITMFEAIINSKTDGINIPLAATEGLPNLGNAKVKFVFGDLTTNELAQSESERLITQEKCVAITGAFSSASTKTAAVSTEKYNVPILSEGTSPALATLGYKYWNRLYASDDLFCDETFKFFDSLNKTKNAGIKTVAIMSEDSEFGKNITKAEVAAAAKYGFNVIENISYNKDATNLSSEIIRLKNANADAVVLSSYIADAILIVKTMKEQNYKPKLMMGQRGGYVQNDFMKTLGTDAEGIMTTGRWALDLKIPTIAPLQKLYTEKYNVGASLSSDVIATCTDSFAVALAINQAGSTKADDIKKALADLKWPADQQFTVLPGVACDATGQNTKVAAIIMQIQNGKYVTVYPEASKSVDAIYPLPAWGK